MVGMARTAPTALLALPASLGRTALPARQVRLVHAARSATVDLSGLVAWPELKAPPGRPASVGLEANPALEESRDLSVRCLLTGGAGRSSSSRGRTANGASRSTSKARRGLPAETASVAWYRP